MPQFRGACEGGTRLEQEIVGDVLRVSEEASLDISIVCPFYNEEQIIGDAINTLLQQLGKLELSWELIVVNDGSTDRSAKIAREIARSMGQLRVLSYVFNRGRGHALRTGIAQARGEIIITTEIDLSWGEDIVDRLENAMLEHPDVDIVIASPHLDGGGYKNVPFQRVFLSRFGNWVIRACMANAASMNTGMTRAYKRHVIRSLPLEEDGKELHLEVILKAKAFGYRFYEIPATLEWKEYKHQDKRIKRKSSTNPNKLVLTHSLFSLFANPIRYVWGLSVVALGLSLGFLGAGVVRYAMGIVSVYLGIMSLALATIAIMLFAFGLIARQGHMIQRELWKLQRDLDRLQRQSGQPAEPLSHTAADSLHDV